MSSDLTKIDPEAINASCRLLRDGAMLVALALAKPIQDAYAALRAAGLIPRIPDEVPGPAREDALHTEIMRANAGNRRRQGRRRR